MGALLFRAPVHDLSAPRDPGRRTGGKLPVIRARLGQAARGEWASLLSGALRSLERDAALQESRPREAGRSAPTAEERAHRFCQVASLGAPAKARRMLDSAGIL